MPPAVPDPHLDPERRMPRVGDPAARGYGAVPQVSREVWSASLSSRSPGGLAPCS
jgi:hypothetical protein